VTRGVYDAVDAEITPVDGVLVAASFSAPNVPLAKPHGSLFAENSSFS
jgi:hypothetical protein